GDSSRVEWGTSDLERRHSFVGSLSWFVRPWIDLTSILRVASGQPYTPRIGGDINGDGSRNDRAYIFNPATTSDTAVANGMARLLANGPANARDCLLGQVGTIAGRNSCGSAWMPSLDFQANLRPYLGAALGRRVNMML